LENSDSPFLDRRLLLKSHSFSFYVFTRKMLASVALVEGRLIGTSFANILPAEPTQPTMLTRRIFAKISQPGIAL
jgi:hypothetical protein